MAAMLSYRQPLHKTLFLPSLPCTCRLALIPSYPPTSLVPASTPARPGHKLHLWSWLCLLWWWLLLLLLLLLLPSLLVTLSLLPPVLVGPASLPATSWNPSELTWSKPRGHHESASPCLAPREVGQMAQTKKTIAVVNGTGRQAASVIRTVAAVGWAVRAQVHSRKGLVAEELEELPNVTLFEGPLLDNPALIEALFEGAQYAFVNTISQAGDEVKIGKALANAAKRARVQHYLYGSMPDHSVYNPAWPALPMWSCKLTVENYIRQLGLPASFLYAGIYNNNFTSLPYPLFSIEFKEDETLEWKAPFHPDTKLPWLDAEHDVGPAVLQLLKDGAARWKDRRIALSFENLTPRQVCQAFERALGRPCRYVFDKHVDIKVPIPTAYRQQLAGIEILFGKFNAPYFPGPDFDYSTRTRRGSRDTERRSPDSMSDGVKNKPKKLTTEARQLWAGYRGIEEYAREVFPIEEEANGKTWMRDIKIST